MSRVIASFLVAFGLAIALLASERFVMAQAGPYGTLMGVAGGGVAAGGTVTGGQLVVNFDPVGTATNQASLFINMPSGAAATDKALAIKTNDTTDRFSVDNSGAVDVPGTMGNSGTGTCNNITAGALCVPDDDGLTVASTTSTASAFLSIRSPYNQGNAWVRFYDSSNTNIGWVGYTNTSNGDADYANRLQLGGSRAVSIFRSDEAAPTSPVLEVKDNTAATGVNLFIVNGSGAVKWNPNTSAAGITCNSTNEGMEYVRVIAASNKSGKCLCTQTSSGVYAWTVSYTGGGTALVAGDC